MSFDYRKEFAKFKREWAKQEKIMREAGMSEEAIAELYDFSHEQFKSDRNYGIKKQDIILADIKFSSGRKARQDMAEQPSEFDVCFDALEQIENPILLNALKKLPQKHYELYCLYVIHGFTQVEIAKMTNQSKQNVHNKIRRIEKFIKKFF